MSEPVTLFMIFGMVLIACVALGLGYKDVASKLLDVMRSMFSK